MKPKRVKRITYGTQLLMNEIEDYVGGNIAGLDNVDWMSFTRFLRSKLNRFADAIRQEKRGKNANSKV